MNTNQVILTGIILSKKTKKVTKIENFEELYSKRNLLFKEDTKDTLITKLKYVYGDKVKDFGSEDKTELRNLLINSLIVRYELSQRSEGTKDDNSNFKFLQNRINIGTFSSGNKRYWQNVDFKTVIDDFNDGLKIGDSISQFYIETGFIVNDERKPVFLFIERLTSTIATVEDGNVVSRVKRKNKTSGALTKEGKLLFTHTNLVLKPVNDEVEYGMMYSVYAQQEQDNITEFKHDGEYDLSPEIYSVNGGYDDEFQNELNTLYQELNLKKSIVFKPVAVTEDEF